VKDAAPRLLLNAVIWVLAAIASGAGHCGSVIGPQRLPPDRRCTAPLVNSLVTGERIAAYLKVCGEVAANHPTTLVITDVVNAGRKVSYQLSAQRPHLLSTDDLTVRWLELVPEASRLSDGVALVEFDIASKRTTRLSEVRVGFSGLVLGTVAGGGCAMARVRGGPDAPGSTALIMYAAGRLQLLPTERGEDVVFWDPDSDAFVLNRWPDATARGVDCAGKSVALSEGAKSLLANRRDPLDRYLSIPATRSVVFDPIETTRGPATLFRAEAGHQGRVYEARADFPSAHAVAGDTSGWMAVSTGRSIEVMAPSHERHSIALAGAMGWYTQIGFLKNRPVLIALDDARLTTFDVER